MSRGLSIWLRRLAGMVALSVLLALALVVGSVRTVRAPAVVGADQTFSVVALEPGRYAWTLESGRSPIGAGMVSQRSLETERSEVIEVAVPAAVSSGQAVQQEQIVAELGSQRTARRLEEVLAEKDGLEAQRDLLVSGGRPEAIATAERGVAVASARQSEAQAAYDRLNRLAGSGAVSAEDLRQAELELATEARQVELARALATAARSPARPEELMAIDAQLSGAEARISEILALLDDQQVKSPIAGLAEVGGDSLVRVYDLDPVYARAAVRERDRAHLVEGGKVVFRASATGARFEGRVAAIADSVALTPGGEPVFYVTAEIPNPTLALRAGMSGSVEFHEDGLAGRLASRATDGLGL